RRGNHDYDETPEEVNAGYQLSSDGTRVEGCWARYACRHCNYRDERWEGPDVVAAPLKAPFIADVDDAPGRRWDLSGVWEHPATTWAVVAIVIALAAYAVYWDAHLRRGPSNRTE